ncbi:MAG: SpoIIE family protein phosphatase [bacterium]|jgi:serine phosphatase RsbU (regulator of sigma subunit)
MTDDKQSVLAGDAWPEPSEFKKSIRLEFTMYVSVIIVVLMAVTGYVISSQYVKTVTENVVEKLVVQARSYSNPAGKLIISEDGPDALLLNNICKKLADDNPDVHWAGITGDDGVFLAHTDIRQVMSGEKLKRFAASGFFDILRPDESFAIASDTIYISVGIRENEVNLGTLAVAASAEPILGAKRASILTVLYITAAMILLGIPATIVILRRKLSPIGVITDHLKGVDLENLSIDIPVRSENEFGFLAETLRVMGSKLNVAKRALVDKERMEREYEIAREIQANILPREYPSGAHFEIAGAYRSAKEVGGDYYDFVEFDENRLGILVADVSGKSLPGMLVMLMTRDIVKELTKSFMEPEKLLAEVNRRLLPNIKKGMFVTMFFGVLDRRDGRFRYASAGHNPLVVLSRDLDSAKLVKTKGYPLGMVPAAAYEKRVECREITLGEGDWLIQYTDGVNEAQDRAGNEFGMERFVSMVESHRDLEAAELVDRVLAQHAEFVGDAPQYDDITLLALKWTAQVADMKRETVGRTAYVGQG